MRLIRSTRSHPFLPLLDVDLTRATTFSLWQRPNAFPIGFDCIRIFEVLLGGDGTALRAFVALREEMLSCQTAVLAPIGKEALTIPDE